MAFLRMCIFGKTIKPMNRYLIPFLAFQLFLFACANDKTQPETPEENPSEMPTKYQTTGSIERLDPAIDQLIAAEAQLEILADSFVWSEGPLWVDAHQMLLFSDIPPNRIYKWTEEGGKELYLTPSGYTGEKERGGEPGSNALLLDDEGRLVLCQHGDRRMARMDRPVIAPEPVFTTLAGAYDGKLLNSPNDAVFNRKGELYFTDPPYGLEQQATDPTKELDYQGVFKVDTSGQVFLLTDELTRPNGIAFSPDESKLYVANSDPERAIWMEYTMTPEGMIQDGKVFYDATEKVGTAKGLPDGMKVDDAGNIYATGPGGVWVFSPEGKQLGLIRTGEATSNCAFNADKSVLYITADMYLMRLKLK